MTILEVIQRSTEFLAKRGVDAPRLQVELLLAHVLREPRLKLYLDFARQLTEPELEPLRALVQRRGRREPLQHLVGSTSFCGLELAVSPAVLIPRPETEPLAERAWQHLASLGAEAPAVLDFGTGSGCLAITLAVRCAAARVYAVDISEAALQVARANAARHGVESRIQFHCGDGWAVLPAEARCDLIVTNPPYIPSGEIASLPPEVCNHDPRLALDGGADGLDFYRRLATEAGAWLRPGGQLMAEFGDGQAEAVSGLFAASGWQDATLGKDLDGRARFLVVQAPRPAAP